MDVIIKKEDFFSFCKGINKELSFLKRHLFYPGKLTKMKQIYLKTEIYDRKKKCFTCLYYKIFPNVRSMFLIFYSLNFLFYIFSNEV